jgi:hypothetical protein
LKFSGWTNIYNNLSTQLKKKYMIMNMYIP